MGCDLGKLNGNLVHRREEPRDGRSAGDVVKRLFEHRQRWWPSKHVQSRCAAEGLEQREALFAITPSSAPARAFPSAISGEDDQPRGGGGMR